MTQQDTIHGVFQVVYRGGLSMFFVLTYPRNGRLIQHSATLSQLRSRSGRTLSSQTVGMATMAFFRDKVVAESAGSLRDLSRLRLNMVFKTPAWMRSQVQKVCQSRSISARAYTDATPEAFNGVRPKAARRV